MGLDISYYKGPLIEVDNDEGKNWLVFTARNINGFGRLGSLKEGQSYLAKERFGFHAGSYSGYNHYRAKLCQLFLGEEDPKAVWKKPDAFKDKPFFLQINFSDNEDTFGPEVCAKLAWDYVNGQHKISDWDRFYRKVYENFMKAFTLAGYTRGAVNYG